MCKNYESPRRAIFSMLHLLKICILSSAICSRK